MEFHYIYYNPDYEVYEVCNTWCIPIARFKSIEAANEFAIMLESRWAAHF